MLTLAWSTSEVSLSLGLKLVVQPREDLAVPREVLYQLVVTKNHCKRDRREKSYAQWTLSKKTKTAKSTFNALAMPKEAE